MTAIVTSGIPEADARAGLDSDHEHGILRYRIPVQQGAPAPAKSVVRLFEKDGTADTLRVAVGAAMRGLGLNFGGMLAAINAE